jgi:hypothetical protein
VDTGWHPHPDRPGTYRYWDGHAWTGLATAAEVAELAGQPPTDDDVLQRTPHGLACPKCGGTQFKARRTAGDRTMIALGTVTTGVGGILSAQKRQQKVQCVTCGTFYERA